MHFLTKEDDAIDRLGQRLAQSHSAHQARIGECSSSSKDKWDAVETNMGGNNPAQTLRYNRQQTNCNQVQINHYKYFYI
ncbi:hypothetical protein Ngar_c09590 [Candidatus Nitrososphaera gargensis Ga9.2]|uniref:Uncharacterized protein n=1 Tax=Nitrososphaera gargensis (strain Ga9.2) TaxID=1237085 RepID=K0I991_NITGG|nr:hypothetical protein Ngar_c09590 [Candidatus Nitrososphaera gargensis Ga9.2]